MRERLTDEQVAQIRAVHSEGQFSLQDVADRFGTTKQHVSRLVRGEQRTEFRSYAPELAGPRVVATIERLFDENGIDVEQDVTAVTALAIAEKLDQVRSSATGQAAMAAPGLAKALQELLDGLQVLPRTGPRLGALRGDEAVLIATALGFEDPENVEIDAFDQLEMLKLRRARRRGEVTGAHRGRRRRDAGLSSDEGRADW